MVPAAALRPALSDSYRRLPAAATAALRAWVEAIVSLGNYYYNQFGAGHRNVIQLLIREESNLLHRGAPGASPAIQGIASRFGARGHRAASRPGRPDALPPVTGPPPCLHTIGRGPTYKQLGNLYDEVGQAEQAREHYEKAAQYFEQSGNRFNAGQTRFNMAVMYLSSASRESTASGRETLLLRAQTYAAAALRDFQHYEGRAAVDEADCRQLIDDIQQELS